MPPKSNLSTIIRGIQGTPLVITDQGEAKVFLSNATSSGLATEATLLAIYNNMVASQDVEILLVRDIGNAGKVVQQIREYDQGTGVWTTRYEDVDGTAYVPVGPLEYLDPSAVLNLVLAELIDQGLTLDSSLVELQAINTNTDQLETLLTTIDTVLDNSLVQLQAINVNTDQLEALSTDIKNLLTTIDADTSNIATDIAAIEVLITTTNALLTTIDGVLDQIQTNTLNTVNELTSANVTLAAVQNELIALNNTASTLATEATLELVRLLLVSLDGKDFATETTLNLLAAIRFALGSDGSPHGVGPDGLRALGSDGAIDRQLRTDASGHLQIDVLSSNLPAGAATETTLGLVLTELQGINLDTNGLNQEATQLAIATDIATIETNIASLNTKLNTLGQKASAASAPVVFSTEQEAILAAIQTAVQNIDADLGTGGLALETTQQAIQTLITSTNALLTTIDADTSNLDVLLSTRASEAKLEQVRLLLAAIDGNTDQLETLLSVIDTVLDSISLDVAAINTNTGSTVTLLGTIDADTGAIATSAANIDTALTPTTRTHNYAVSNGVGNVPAGSMCGSVLNNGSSAGTWSGNALPPGVSVEWSAVGNRDTYGAIAFDATGTEFIIEYTT